MAYGNNANTVGQTDSMGMRQGIVKIGPSLAALFAIALLALGTGSCAKPTEPTVLISEPTAAPSRLVGQLAEVSPPPQLETLKQVIDAYTPQVRILSPRPGEILEDTSVSVRVQVRGLPLFKDDTWQLGPHLHVFLDNEPYRAVYDVSEPLVFDDLAPGTHTLRVFASRPWHESFKNQGAYDQRTFHVFAQTPQNELNANVPLLTYSRPQGRYGAEPIMLDFYLTNAPLHMSAQADQGDDLHDWRIRCTVNDQSFVFDQWQPIYLKGFKPGRNWVQLELIDEAGRPIDNRFNNTVRIIDYEPGGQDTLSKLVRGELDLEQVGSIIDPTYVPPTPEPEPIPTVEAEPLVEPTAPPDAETDPTLEEEPQPLEELTPAITPESSPAPDATLPPVEPKAELEPMVEPVPVGLPEVILPQLDPTATPDRSPSLDLEPAPKGGMSSQPETPEASPEPKEPSLTPAPARLSPQNLDNSAASESVPSAETEAEAGLAGRYRQWLRQRTPEPAPSSPEQVPPFVMPQSPGSLTEPLPEPSRAMPELVEPYLTEPYLTEPRLGVSSPDADSPEPAEMAPDEATNPEEQDSNPSPPDSFQRENKSLSGSSERPFI